MKSLHLLIALVIVGIIAACTVSGCGVRSEIAKRNMLSKVDSLLGEMEVKREEIRTKTTALENGLSEIQKAKIKALVQRDQLSGRAARTEDQIGRIDTALKNIRERVTQPESETNQLVGNLRMAADRLITDRHHLDQRLAGIEQSEARLTEVATSLEARQSEYEATLGGIRNQLMMIDTNRETAEALKEAATVIGGSTTGFAESLSSLEEQVSDLYAEVESDLLSQDARLSVFGSRQSLDSTEAILREIETAKDLVYRIDETLGSSLAESVDR